MILYFLLGRRATPGPSPVMAEVFRRLTARGFRVESGIAESALIRTDDLAPGYDLYLLKSYSELALSLAGVLHVAGARLLNPYPNGALARNKIVASRLLGAAGVPTPRTWVTDDFSLLEAAVAAQPLIIKPYLGYSGTGVRLVRTARELAALPPPQGPVLIQEYVPGRGDDLKVYVAGDDVFAVRKPFSPTSFIVPGRPVPVTPAVRDLALRCGQVFGLGLYGVDIVEAADGPWIVDVNTFPGYKGAPGAAARIADYIADYALGRRVLPEIAAPPALEAGRP